MDKYVVITPYRERCIFLYQHGGASEYFLPSVFFYSYFACGVAPCVLLYAEEGVGQREERREKREEIHTDRHRAYIHRHCLEK